MPIFDELLDLLYRHDPVGLIEVGAPKDEYWPEVEALLPRLREARSQDHLRRIVHAVFLQQFEAEETCGPESAYEAISQEIWAKFLADRNTDRPVANAPENPCT
jgi:hypothetical protein